MTNAEATHSGPPSPEEQDPATYWLGISGYLHDEGITPSQHAQSVFRDMDVRIGGVSRRHFSARGSVGPYFLESHEAMRELLSQPAGEAEELEIMRTFPIWKAGVDEVIGYLEGNQ